MLVEISIIGTAILLGLGLLGLVVAAFKSMAQGKQEWKRIGSMSIPVLAFGASYLAMGGLVEAAILATGIMMGLLVLAIAFSGARGVFK